MATLRPTIRIRARGDDTSVVLCLAECHLVRGAFDPFDQLARYRWSSAVPLTR
jgi:hypothetical protein